MFNIFHTHRCGWLMHEGGHYSLTGKIAIDRTLQIIIYGVGCGMSGSWWRNQHNKHHAMPQRVGKNNFNYSIQIYDLNFILMINLKLL
jgi:fatty acid desaturase